MKRTFFLIALLALAALPPHSSYADERFVISVKPLAAGWEDDFPAELPDIAENPILPDLSEKPPSLDQVLARLEKESPVQSWFAFRALEIERLTDAERGRLAEWLRAKSADATGGDVDGPLGIAARLSRLGGATRADAEKIFADLYRRARRRQMQNQGAIEDFCAGASATSREMLEEIVRDSTDPVNTGNALAALAKLRGPEILADLPPFFARRGMSHAVLRTLATLADAGEKTRADAFVVEHHQRLGSLAFEYAILHGGSDSVKWAADQKSRMEPRQRFEFEWREKALTSDAFFTRLVAEKLAPRMPNAREREKLVETFGTQKVAEATRALALLRELGVALWMDAEADEVPPPYPEAFARFSKLSGGIFLPRGLRQTEPDEDDEAPPTVTFAVAGRKITLRPRQLADWFDVEAIEATANRALELSGSDARFIPLATSDQTAMWVFGHPAKWKALAAEFALPLGRADGDAVKRGKDYERQVEEHMEKDDDCQ